MPLSAAERQKRYKQKMKLDPEKYDQYKTKKRDNYHKKKRLVKDLTPKEKYNARVIWRLRKQNLRRNKKNLTRVLDITPPSSPTMLQPNDIDMAQDEAQNGIANNSGIDIPENPEVSKKSRGRKKKNRDRSKLYRQNLRLQQEIEQLKKKFEKYKKRLQRNNPKKKETIQPDEKTKYKHLSSAMKEKYQNTKKHKEKKILKSIFEDVDNCTKEEMIRESLGLTGQLRNALKVRPSATKLKKAIECFFQREDISRATAGKKETVTRNGEKVQKRFLLDTMKNLHKTFQSENSTTKCSYYYFTRNKPFYIIKPSVSGREMCLCKTHTNPAYKAKTLKSQGIINTDDMNQLVAAIVCNTKLQDCMYGTCNVCRDQNIVSDADKDQDKIQWKEWGRVEEAYEKDGKTLKAFKNVKQDKEGTVKELMLVFNAELKVLKKHIYNMKVQFTSFRQAIDNLQQTEAVIVADFSENYSCKHNQEIQAHHFGASRLQVSLHTVVVYINSENNKKVESYCTVSSNTNHQPAAIWAHLDPVLKDIRGNHPEITTIHFFTDGPFSQYRQKQNFYLSSTATFDHGFQAMSWSFFEAGHGKGPADGIGGYLKRSADELVARGEDISNTDQFYRVLKDVSKIKLYVISSEDIQLFAKEIPSKIQPLIGTKHVHQIFTTIRGELKYRNLSCFCSRSFCECLLPKIYRPLVLMTQTGQRKRYARSDGIEDENDAIENVINKPEVSVESAQKDREIYIDTDILMRPDDNQVSSNFSDFQRQKSPLSEIGYLELNKARKNSWYNAVYSESSEDEQARVPQPSTSTQHAADKENRGVRLGDFLLVNVSSKKGQIFKYVCVVEEMHEDGDIRVTFLRYVKNKNTFTLDKSDVADIDYTDIVKILDVPNKITKRGVQYYIFKYEVDISKK